MTPTQLSDLSAQAMWLVLLASLPAVVSAAVIALFVAVAQTVTQIQDQSIGQAIRQVVVFGVIILTAPWVASEMLAFGSRIFSAISEGRLAP